MDDYSNQIESLLANDSFVRWIEGRASQIEISDWEIWLQEDPARKKLKEEAIKIHGTFQFKANRRADLEYELTKLNKSVDQFEDFKGLSVHRRNHGRGFGEKYYPLVAAVALLIVVGLGSLYFFDAANKPEQNDQPTLLTRSTEFGKKKLLTLTDGSTVLLNANTQLKLPESHSGNLELWLKGEAYFNITHQTGAEKRKVTVQTPDGNIQVLGTEFNVNTFDRGTEVVLSKGKVKVEVAGKTGSSKTSRIMVPGEMSQFIADQGEIDIEPVNLVKYTSWTNDKLIFEQTPITEIAERIEQIYGVKFIIDDPELGKTKISGSIPNDNLPIFLEAIEKILQQPITRDKGRIQVGSTDL